VAIVDAATGPWTTTGTPIDDRAAWPARAVAVPPPCGVVLTCDAGRGWSEAREGSAEGLSLWREDPNQDSATESVQGLITGGARWRQVS
jgi:hypothetical protein